MRTDLLAYILSSENRKKIVKTLLEYPNRQWSCPTVEDATKVSHATVFRTLNELAGFGILKTFKLSKKILLFELVESPLLQQIKKLLQAEKRAMIEIAKNFAGTIKSKEISSCILFGSVAKGNITKESDIDVLVLIKKANKQLEKEILNKAAEVSVNFNKTISPTIMQKKTFERAVKERKSFALEVLKDMVLLYGKKPSRAS